MKKYPNLFSPIKIGNLTLKNRIIASPTSSPSVSHAEFLKKDNIAFYELRAKGGAAVVTLGDSIVHSPTGPMHPYKLPMDNPGLIPSLADTARSIKQHNCIPSLELSHGGKFANIPNFISKNTIQKDRKPYGPNHEINEDGIEIFEMPEEIIMEIVEAYGDAALTAKNAGFEMVVVHGGHGWLLNQFMSPATNHRTDKFGASFENRMRLPLMVLDNIRSKVGPGFPIEFRMSGAEFTPGGYDIDYGVEIAKAVEDKVDLIHVSAGVHDNPDTFIITHPSMFHEHGCNVYLAEAIKKAVKKVPVATIGGLSDPAQMEEIIASGKADIVEMSRSLMADPYLPKKAMLGKDDEIVKCIRCFVCMNTLRTTRYMRCTLNPVIGRELEHQFERPKTQSKKVLVAGGGPAGMKAALTAAERGHEVILCEKTDQLGGQIKYEEHVSFKKDMYDFSQQLARRVESSNIDLRLNTEVTRQLAESIAPDVIIASVGAKPIIPDIPGIISDKVKYIYELAKKSPDIGQKVVILGAGLVGCETAIHLNKLGKDVTIVEMADDYAKDAVLFHKQAITQQFEGNIELHLNTKAIAVKDEGLLCIGEDGQEKMFEADTIFCAAGMKACNELVEELRDVAPEFYALGDCVRPGQLTQAIYNGYYYALDI
jgi:2,4-dienoyl-CoA reductase-like NADH-dependent reductase (Old Yellow Enzyme family)/thioredoxin reductase